jgi:hypothetical protein
MTNTTFFNSVFLLMKRLVLTAVIFAVGVVVTSPEGTFHAICSNALMGVVVAIAASLCVAFARSPLRRQDISYARDNFVCAAVTTFIALLSAISVELNRLSGYTTTTGPFILIAIGMLSCAIFFASALRGEGESDFATQ